MRKLVLNPNVSVGPFVFGTEQKEMWKIMKNEFGSERDPLVERSLPAYETEYYANPDVNLSYKDNKLISVTFIDDIRERYCEIYLGKEKIWPRTEKKFLSIFGRDSFVEVYGSYYHTEFSLAVGWDDSEAVENYQLFDTVLNMKKGMNRNDCRMLINRIPVVSDDGKTDHYHHGVIRPEKISLTYDSRNNLVKLIKTFPDGEIIDFFG